VSSKVGEGCRNQIQERAGKILEKGAKGKKGVRRKSSGGGGETVRAKRGRPRKTQNLFPSGRRRELFAGGRGAKAGEPRN